MISKPFEQITASDIADLCAHGGAYESLILEFKRELPNRDGRLDPWMAGGNFSNYARDNLFREIVAFANASGGTLVLGIAETNDLPPRAAAIVPLPRIHDLAARLEEAARACIEPPLGSLMIRGIPQDDDDKGVIIFRTVASPFGPHRVVGDGHSFIRRGSSSIRMTMREIQDLTLDLARGADRLDAVIKERATSYTRWFRYSNLAEKGSFRVTAAPVSRLPQAIRIADRMGQTPPNSRFRVQLDGGSPTEVVCPIRPTSRPILRGYRFYDDDDDSRASQLDIYDSGLIDLWFWRAVNNGWHLHLGWILGGALTVLRLADWLRAEAGAPEWEFGIELELDGFSGVAAPPDQRIPLATLVIGTWGGSATIRIPRPPIEFPRLMSRSRTDDEDITNVIARDLLDAAGDRYPWPRMTILSEP